MGSYKTSDELFQAQAHLYRLMYSFLNPMCIKWAVDLDIPTIIHNHGQPIPLSKLISDLSIVVPQTKVTSVQRLMRLLAHNDLFKIVKINDDEEEEAYELTPTSQLLVKGSNHCLSSMVNFLNGPHTVEKYHHLAQWIAGDQLTIDEAVYGRGSWDFIHQDPTLFKTFNDAMESDSHVVRSALRDCKSIFEGLDSIVDVGGGTGNTAKIICEAFPNLKYTVLDLPSVVAHLEGTNNLTFLGGSMFESIPQAEAVLIKWVLHNWSDDDCLKILKNCKEAISRNKQGKVIIIDIVINEKQDEHEMTEVKLLFDVAMMAVLNGKERNEKEWKQLFMKAGFKNYKIFPTFGFRSLIELYP